MNVWCHYLGTTAEVDGERITLPPSQILDGLEGKTSQKILQGATNAEGMVMTLLNTKFLTEFLHVVSNTTCRQRMTLAMEGVCEEMFTRLRIVESDVVGEGSFKITRSELLGEE